MKTNPVLTCMFLILAYSLPSMSQDKGGIVRLRVKDQKGSIAQTETVIYENSYALLIGNSKYRDPSWPDLTDVPQDIAAVKAVLENVHGLKTEVAVNQTRELLLKLIDQFISKYGQRSNNRIVFYFSGHGYTSLLSDGRRMGYLVMSDAPSMPDEEDALRTAPSDEEFERFLPSAITTDEIETYARRFTAKHVLFVFDSCFSGTVLYRSGNGDIPDGLTTEELKPVRAYLTSGNETQRVPSFSTFRRKLTAGLMGDADTNLDGYILCSELARWVSIEVERETGRRQTPVFGKSDSFKRGDVIFVSPKGSSSTSSFTSSPATMGSIGSELRSANKSLRVLYSVGVIAGGPRLASHEVFPVIDSFNSVLRDSLEEEELQVSTLGQLGEQDQAQYFGAINTRYQDRNALKSFQFALFVSPGISLQDLGINEDDAYITLATGHIDIIDTENGKTILYQPIGPTRGYGRTQVEARKNALRAAALSIPDSFFKSVAQKAR